MSISRYSHPRPGLQKVMAIILLVGFAGVVVGTIGLLAMGIILDLPLMILAIPFLLGMSAPLLLRTSLHPAIEINDDGLRLYPLVWKATTVRWEDLAYTREHPLLRPPPPSRLARKGVQSHEGIMIVAQRDVLPWHYRLIGLMVGDGFNHPAFAISNRSHTEYKKLRDIIKKQLRGQSSE